MVEYSLVELQGNRTSQGKSIPLYPEAVWILLLPYGTHTGPKVMDSSHWRSVIFQGTREGMHNAIQRQEA